jgi:hypothetical protein
MSAKFTPGPWTVTEHSWSRTGIYAEHEAIAALDIYNDATEDNQDELEGRMAANARLIAAAPDLLEVLIAVRDSFIYEDDHSKTAVMTEADNHAFDQVCAAIAKATGEPA